MTVEETKSTIDLLFSEVKAYRKSKRFSELLSFCAQFKTLAPYNAMLVHLQMPHARFVLTPGDWKKYHRKIRAYARPLVILIPFGPVDFVFEIQDTYTPKKSTSSFPDEYIIDEVEKPFRVDGHVDSSIVNKLAYLMQFHGVAYNPHMHAGVDLNAEISPIKEDDEPHPINIYVNKHVNIDSNAKFLVCTNEYADAGEKIAGIAHEMGHLFCQHLPCPKGWGGAWEQRNLDDDVKEFEAEAVARMVCDRLGYVNKSEKYLAPYLMKHNEIPHDVSIENICFAANKILTMIFDEQKMTYRDGYLYKYDEKFKSTVKQKLNEYKQWKQKR